MLIDFQTEYNWLPKHVLFYVGNKVNAPLSQIYSIASFYKFFNLEPRGKYQIIVCAGTACHVRGSMNLLQRIVNVLKIKPGDTTSDYKFTLDTVNCLGCCALGPVMLFNNKYYSNPSKKDIEKLFSSLA
jgi:NADH-quinone oxidoreductase subunit E